MTVDYVTFSNLIIDDIVFPDGRKSMNVLGGAGTHALVGMRVWNGRLGYAASVGKDFDPIHRHALQQFGADITGLIVPEGYKTARAWQVFDANDLRVETFQTELDEFLRCHVQEEDLPRNYRQAQGFHLIWGSLTKLGTLIHSLRRTNPTITLVVEPTPQQVEEPAENFQAVLPYMTLFSPNIDEATAVTGSTIPEEMADIFLAWGAPLVSIRMGAKGSLVKMQSGEQWHLPSVPTDIVDVTGAGNSYCGGFLTGLGDGLSPFEASLRAAVSASFALEQFGLPAWASAPTEEANRRLAWAKENIIGR
jgi:sugar/nucleoside kinase (ribokinase family)